MGLGLLGACLAITAPCARGFSFAGGPRNIDLPVATFHKLSAVWATIDPGTDGHPEDQMARWGTFDGPSHSLIAYPDAPGTVRSTVRLWLVFGSPTNQSSHIFEWPISGKASALFVLQASTDLITWKSLATNSNDGSVIDFFQWVPTDQQRFYRSFPQSSAADVRSGSSQVVATNAHVRIFPSGGTLTGMREAPVTALLDIYAISSGLELIVASPVKQMGSLVIVLPERHGRDWGGGKFLPVIEKALLDQRGIVMTRVDDKRVSVTYNDALEATPIRDEFTLPTLKIPLTRPLSHRLKQAGSVSPVEALWGGLWTARWKTRFGVKFAV